MEYYFYNTDNKDPNLLGRHGRISVLIDQGFAATSGNKDKYGQQLGQLGPDDTLVMYENGVGILAVGTVLEPWDQITHKPPLYYQPGSHGDHEFRIKVHWFLDLSNDPITLAELKYRDIFPPRGAIRRIDKRRNAIVDMIAERRAEMPSLPEEISAPSLYVEGATRQVSINAYERNIKARSACINEYGTDCWICKFNFGSAYGAEAEGFIHVHHLRPLAEIGGEYVVDPIKDLRPVCPNCHAVLHLGGRTRTIEEVQECVRLRTKA